ncbi:hypothetical protein ACP0HM_01050 [Escherichia coli]
MVILRYRLPRLLEHAAAVLNLVDDGVIEWNDPEVVRALRGALKTRPEKTKPSAKKRKTVKTA